MNSMKVPFYRMARGCRFEAHSGISALAAAMDVNLSTLEKKLNPHNETHFPTIVEVDAWMDWCNDYKPLIEWCRRKGMVCLPLMDPASSEMPGDVFLEFSRFTKEFADVVQSANTAWADGHISEAECAEVEKQFNELSANFVTFMRAMRAKALRG